ncbi:mannose-1-phosphate guanylyltransferase/mannose-6-phosphate isomerase [Rhizobium sp. FKL33]|uniref:mannose-1-phosphate guanylyltransferase/mannose-6-phosphate isomerase n=1 Tax=Rhizobium sp. FKL33 TaxID=2562307 RepID=UPI0010C00E52|nr:mannose-1-phosphate guanylyltransferase/mannose-6-phosphate isomerase [Rhizobium sp. FKL33]
MSQDLIVPVILAGGKGTRLWPMSRSARPKQFLALTGDDSLFQLTLKRLKDPKRYGKPIVVTNSEYRFLVAEQALEAGVELEAVILEPTARNTAPAIAAATLIAAKNGPRLVHVLASDHNIRVDDAYVTAIDTATAAARAGRLATFGITPTSPATGFGYIEAGAKEASGAHVVQRFVEKPNEERAKEMLATGNYYWNSGMFLFNSDVFLGECAAFAPDVLAAAKASVDNARVDLDFVRLGEADFAKSPDISVDYAIFEHTKLASVAPSPIQWSDLGAWDAVWKESECDADGNVARGPVNLYNTKNSFVFSESAHVAVNGVEDAVVLVSEDAVYVGKLTDAQDVGKVVKDLMKNPATAKLTEEHRTSYRPWGGYTSVLMGERFQVKRIFVKPGKQLSLQKHHHRSEHWIVVRGTAEVQIGETKQMLRENESIYIPQGELHRLSNPGKILLELVEVQTGSYLGEDDIVRIEDTFGRA